jgi:hypothetical protein
VQSMLGQSGSTSAEAGNAEEFSCWYPVERGDASFVEKLTMSNPLSGLTYLRKQELLIDRAYLMVGTTYVRTTSLKKVRFIESAFHGAKYLIKPALRGAFFGVCFVLLLYLWRGPATVGLGIVRGLLIITTGFAAFFVLWAVPKTKFYRFGILVLESEGGRHSLAVRMWGAKRLLRALEKLGCEVKIEKRNDSAAESELRY